MSNPLNQTEEDYLNNLQSLRNKIKISLETCDKVLDDFSNLIFMEKNLINCSKDCFDKFSKIFSENEKNEFFDFSKLKREIAICANKCDENYKKVLDHQIKGAEISYFTYQKHLNKCKELNKNEPEKLLNCYNFKVEKIVKRFGSYFFNQRMNLVNRLNKE